MYVGDVARETQYIQYVASTAVAGMSRVDAVHCLRCMYGGYCDVTWKTRYFPYATCTVAISLCSSCGTLLTMHVPRLLQCHVEDAVLTVRNMYGDYCDVAWTMRYFHYVAATMAAGRRGTLLT
jgi:hypothetical protein